MTSCGVTSRSAGLFKAGPFVGSERVVVDMFVIVFCPYCATECENVQ